MVIFSSGFDHHTGCKIYCRISFIRCLNRDTSCLCYVPGTLLKQLRTFTLREHIGYRERETYKYVFLKLCGMRSERDLQGVCWDTHEDKSCDPTWNRQVRLPGVAPELGPKG